MTLKKKILAGVFIVAVGTSMAVPTTARADDWWHHHDRDDQSWLAREHDHDRDWNYRDRDNDRRYLPPNGEGMINRRNPDLYWACDSEGHHCHWARR